MPADPPATSAISDVPGAPPPMPPVTPPPIPEPTPPPAPVETPPTEPTTPPTTPPSAAEKSGPITQRLSEIASQRRAAEERAARLEQLVSQQSEQLRDALAAINRIPTVQTPPVVPSDDPSVFSEPRPARETFSDPESYDAALVSWVSEKTAFELSSRMRREQEELDQRRADDERVRTEAEARRQQDEQVENVRNTYNERRAKALEKYEDFSDVAEANDVPITVAMANVIIAHDDGPEIAYYLGKNKAEAARIANMIVPGQVFPAGTPLAGTPVPDAARQAFELGKIAAKLGLSSEPAPPSVPSTPTAGQPSLPLPLPEPPSVLSGGSAAANARAPSEMSMEEYAAMRQPQILATRRPNRLQ